MGRPVINLRGKKFGRLRVFEEYGRDKHGGVLWKCLCDCGKTTVVRGSSLTRKNKKERTVSCGCYQKEHCHGRGAKNPAYKTGRTKNSQGYILLSGHQDHPRCNNKGQVLEHVIVMETRLGRYLYDKETVHHKNGKRDDNRDDNLELWSSSRPPGQRVEDLVIWAEGILRTYSPQKLVQNYPGIY
jgi:hypothetical protein